MKSKVLTYPPIEDIILSPEQKIVDRSSLEEEIETELDFIRRKKSEVRARTAGEMLEDGDAVVVNVSCDKADAPRKFKREGIGIKLGSGYYDEKVEAALIGSSLGESINVDAGADGEWPVRVESISAQHNVLVPLTDEDFQREGEDNGIEVKNEEEFIDFLKSAVTDAQNVNHFFDVIFDDLQADMTSRASFEIDDEEMKQEIAAWVAAEGELESIDDLTDEEMAHYEEIFKFNLILSDIAKDMPLPTEEEFAEVLEFTREQGYTEEEIEQLNDFDRYVYDYLVDAGQTILRTELEKQYDN